MNYSISYFGNLKRHLLKNTMETRMTFFNVYLVFSIAQSSVVHSAQFLNLILKFIQPQSQFSTPSLPRVSGYPG